MKNSRVIILYIVLFFVLSAFPLYGLIFYEQPENTENKELAKKPELNLEFLSESGDYFSDHFAGRQELITMDSMLRYQLFGVSGQDIVIAGEDNWLYYKDTLKDYQRVNLFSPRMTHNIVKVVSLMEEYADSHNAKFGFMIAPNKNTLYPEHMPSYYGQIDGDTNMDQVLEECESQGVNALDLREAFFQEEETLYHQRDSHWNNKGAALAQDGLLTFLDKSHTVYQEEDFESRKDFTGDLDRILYPKNQSKEVEFYTKSDWNYSYDQEVDDMMKMVIQTQNSEGEDSLLMFRDSFGNALIPFLAEEYGQGYFSRIIPYRVDSVVSMGANTCVLEIAERNIDRLVYNAPIMQAPFRVLDFEMTETEVQDLATDLKEEEFESYRKVSGLINPAYLEKDSEIYVRFTAEDNSYTLEAAPAYEGEEAKENGFTLYYLPKAMKAGSYDMEIVIHTKDGYLISGSIQQVKMN
ncbi:hypothetical protein M2454_000373 [Aequitasia blattaphilus]|uniref:AlgX/AlgJ SGNH hydrolase-like domain-containing protein n=1 Tax=Aequitasia blattaphilus TaxID=2949332 RepID=A0ABT1E5Y0_9FIRM|nr:hypothetical protein [Aequitasia blattaphilus]MCP1101235.1 hypothetical protein [Aequitasia blattaphilus]MCR8613875.1 hypothetical protein [Aequitasia blattaphilus]